MAELNSWLDTETKAMLQRLPPSKQAPADTLAFTLVLLSTSECNRNRLLRAAQRIHAGFADRDLPATGARAPFLLRDGLTHADALLAQFELISCDAVSVFIADSVFANAENEYLTELYNCLLASDEFRPTTITIGSLPNSNRADEFVDQFIGYQIEVPSTITAAYKKARIMNHWANKIGGDVRIRRD